MPYYMLKVLLAGDGAVGKSSIVQRFVKERFIKDYSSTVGVDVFNKEVEYEPGAIAKLSIWDIAGQDKYNFMRTNLYYGSDGILLIFDLTRAQTFTNTRRWLIEVRKVLGEKIPFILIGNKADLVEAVGEVIDPEEPEIVAEEENSVYIETSALTGLNIDEAFVKLTRQMLKQKTYSVDMFRKMWKKRSQ